MSNTANRKSRKVLIEEWIEAGKLIEKAIKRADKEYGPGRSDYNRGKLEMLRMCTVDLMNMKP